MTDEYAIDVETESVMVRAQDGRATLYQPQTGIVMEIDAEDLMHIAAEILVHVSRAHRAEWQRSGREAT